MGGTTAKASVIADGEVAVTAEYEVGGSGHANRWMHGTGHPIRVPVIDLAEVSAGGGSHRLGRSGRCAEGRARTAPAPIPGPACYGAGGTAPTVTDADVVLGYLDREALLGGASAHRSRRGGTRDRRGDRAATRADGAGGRGAHRRSRQQQHGAGAAHRVGRTRPRSAGVQPDRVRRRGPGACRVAGRGIADPGGDRAAGARRVLRARTGGERSASATIRARCTPICGSVDPARVAEVFAAMEQAGTRDAATRRACRRNGSALLRQADVRYRRQAYELTVPIAEGDDHPRHAGRTGRGIPRQTRTDLWPCQPRGAGAAGQSAPDRVRPVARS